MMFEAPFQPRQRCHSLIRLCWEQESQEDLIGDGTMEKIFDHSL